MKTQLKVKINKDDLNDQNIVTQLVSDGWSILHTNTNFSSDFVEYIFVKDFNWENIKIPQ